MKLTEDSLVRLLLPQRITAVVDVGANPIDGEPPYRKLLVAGLCHVTGFEPQEEALRELLRRKGPNETYLPYAIGDGGSHTLNVCKASGMTSLYEPDPRTLGLVEFLKPLSEIIERVPVKTRRLDDVLEIAHLDFLKIDIQGGELAVFQSGREKLSRAVVIQTEVSFLTLYKGQPSSGDVDVELRKQGFIPHCFVGVRLCPIFPCSLNDNPQQPVNQLLEADICYVRDISQPEKMDDEQLKQLALIAYHCYGSVDLALNCILRLEQRSALPPGSQKSFLHTLSVET